MSGRRLRHSQELVPEQLEETTWVVVARAWRCVQAGSGAGQTGCGWEARRQDVRWVLVLGPELELELVRASRGPRRRRWGLWRRLRVACLRPS